MAASSVSSITALHRSPTKASRFLVGYSCGTMCVVDTNGEDIIEAKLENAGSAGGGFGGRKHVVGSHAAGFSACTSLLAC